MRAAEPATSAGRIDPATVKRWARELIEESGSSRQVQRIAGEMLGAAMEASGDPEVQAAEMWADIGPGTLAFLAGQVRAGEWTEREAIGALVDEAEDLGPTAPDVHAALRRRSTEALRAAVAEAVGEKAEEVGR